jgi:hypothetical protein
MSDAYFKTANIEDSSDLATTKKGYLYPVGGWTGFYKGEVRNTDFFDEQCSFLFAAWTGFYSGVKKAFTFTRR